MGLTRAKRSYDVNGGTRNFYFVLPQTLTVYPNVLYYMLGTFKSMRLSHVDKPEDPFVSIFMH